MPGTQSANGATPTATFTDLSTESHLAEPGMGQLQKSSTFDLKILVTFQGLNPQESHLRSPNLLDLSLQAVFSS